MHVALKESQVGLRNSTTRIPFRYGSAVLTRCPQVIVRVVSECDGVVQEGFSGDCLPPGWFDKSPGKDFAQQIAEMLQVIRDAQTAFGERFRDADEFFPAWLDAQATVHAECERHALPPLLASFGSSLLERAILDAACRRHGVGFAAAARGNLFGIEAGRVHPELAGIEPREWLPEAPLESIHVRQTVGLGDPLTVEDIAPADRVADGWPQAIEEYATRRGVRYYKVKVSNRLEHDVERLTRLAGVLERHLGAEYRLTLDGNEQYKRAGEFDALIDALRTRPALAGLWQNVLAIEQPLDRAIALSPGETGGIRELSRTKPVIIDESDGTLIAYRQALEAGYRGISSKGCKGAIRSLLNAGLTWLRNDRGRRTEYVMTGEDLCTVGIVPVQSDLCLAATIGLTPVERNGHHYHPGLQYLPEGQQRAALAAHGDFYTDEGGRIGPRIAAGRFAVGSLHCAGFGFAVRPDIEAMEPADTWQFASLGL